MGHIEWALQLAIRHAAKVRPVCTNVQADRASSVLHKLAIL